MNNINRIGVLRSLFINRSQRVTSDATLEGNLMAWMVADEDFQYRIAEDTTVASAMAHFESQVYGFFAKNVLPRLKALIAISDFKKMRKQPFSILFEVVRRWVGLLDLLTRCLIAVPVFFFVFLSTLIMAVCNRWREGDNPCFSPEEDDPYFPSLGFNVCRVLFIMPVFLLVVSLHVVYCLVHAVIALFQHFFKHTLHPVALARQLWENANSNNVARVAGVFSHIVLFCVSFYVCALLFTTFALSLPPVVAVLLVLVPSYIMHVGITSVIMGFTKHMVTMCNMTFSCAAKDREHIVAACDAFFSYPTSIWVCCLKPSAMNDEDDTDSAAYMNLSQK